MFIMCREWNGRVACAPLWVQTLRLPTAYCTSEAEKYAGRYEELRSVPERLRWCRYQLGLVQKEVAERTGIAQTLYEEMERGDCREYPAYAVDKLAELYQVPVDDLLDGYSRFLYDGPVDQIRAARERLGLSRGEFARLADVGDKSVRDWEMGKKKVSRESWERLKAYLSSFHPGNDVL